MKKTLNPHGFYFSFYFDGLYDHLRRRSTAGDHQKRLPQRQGRVHHRLRGLVGVQRHKRCAAAPRPDNYGKIHHFLWENSL